MKTKRRTNDKWCFSNNSRPVSAGCHLVRKHLTMLLRRDKCITTGSDQLSIQSIWCIRCSHMWMTMTNDPTFGSTLFGEWWVNQHVGSRLLAVPVMNDEYPSTMTIEHVDSEQSRSARPWEKKACKAPASFCQRWTFPWWKTNDKWWITPTIRWSSTWVASTLVASIQPVSDEHFLAEWRDWVRN